MTHTRRSDAPSGSRSLEALLRSHCARYPLLGLEDLYKLLHQGTLGSEHAVRGEAGARAWLEEEILVMGSGPDEPLLDPISPDGRIVRVHLRPFVAGGGDPEMLLAAFIRTANEHHGSPEDLPAAWRAAMAWAREEDAPDPPSASSSHRPASRSRRCDAPAGRSGARPPGGSRLALPFSRSEMDSFLAPLEAAGLPAINHSDAYERTYLPAYRVVRIDFLATDRTIPR